MINSLRSTYFDYTSGIDQSFKLNQKSELPPFYGNCIHEIRSINNWSGNLESDKASDSKVLTLQIINA